MSPTEALSFFRPGEIPACIEEIYDAAANEYYISESSLRYIEDKKNRIVLSPSIRVDAYLNQRHNLIVKWHPYPSCGEEKGLISGFTPAFLAIYDYTSDRPDNELMWVKGVGGVHSLRHDPKTWPAAKALYGGLVAAYEGLIERLQEGSKVVSYPKLQLIVDERKTELRVIVAR